MSDIEVLPSILTDDWRSTESGPGVSLWWLGQAGFLLRSGTLRLAIDPYLSDSLARKYAGAAFPHQRIMAPPVAASDLGDLDVVLCTHRHGDHMDPDTLRDIRDASTRCRFVVPAAEHRRALDIGLPEWRVLGIDAGQRLALDGGVSVSAIPAAHEDLSRDAQGQHHFLGYMLSIGSRVIYHSGDCVPYAGLVQQVKPHRPDLALLPINGRDAARQGNGVPGNFTLAEALELAAQAEIPAVIAHHFGMFDFNTVDISDVSAELSRLRPRPHVMLAETGSRFVLR